MRIFVDSDVVISSLISHSGAAYSLLSLNSLKFCISSLSRKELEIVTVRLGLGRESLRKLIKDSFEVIMLLESLPEIKKSFKEYVFDVNDAHIVAGAKKAKANFLITYNIKDFRIEKIKQDLGIVILTPGNFLQYLRSIR